MTNPNKQTTRPPAATGSGSELNSQEITEQEMTSMSVEQSTGLTEWYAAVEALKSTSAPASRGRHAQRPVMDTTIEPAHTLDVDPFGHVVVGDADPDPSWVHADKSLCGALSQTVFPVPGTTGIRYACTRFPHRQAWQHIAADEYGVVEVWHHDESLLDTTVLAVADDLIDNEGQDEPVEPWPATDDEGHSLTPGDRVRAGELTSRQLEALAVVLDIYHALRELGAAIDMPQPVDEALSHAEAALSPQAGA